jgi:hypothetical protein
VNPFLQVAIVGTGQLPVSHAEETSTAVDALVSAVAGVDRERALLLRAGGLATLERAARVQTCDARSLPIAPAETMNTPSARATELIATLFGESGTELLMEALERLSRAGLRLPEALLPVALSQSRGELRARIRPVLGERGRWLAAMKPTTSWALSSQHEEAAEVDTIKARWEEATAAERRALLAQARRSYPDLARALLEASFKQEKAEQRVAWLDVIGKDLTAQDEPFLIRGLTDRSAQVRIAAARLLWLLAESDLARTLRNRADDLISVAPGSVLGTLKSFVGADVARPLIVTLPPEDFDASWESQGIVETPPHGTGRRQWWLAQFIAAVPPDHWARRFQLTPAQVVAAASMHEHAQALLDGLNTAALHHDARAWFAPLWDAVDATKHPSLTPNPLQPLSAKLTPEEAEPRMLALLDGQQSHQLASFARPWPAAVAKRFVEGLRHYKPTWTYLIPIAAMAIPVELLPGPLDVPEVPADDYAARGFLRALDDFQSTARTRRALAEEIPL